MNPTVPDSRASRAASRWVPLLVALVPYALLVARFDFVTDDAFISFRYARNLAAGHGLVFNPGETDPVEGFSNLLWVLLMALVELGGARPDVAARVLSVACGVGLLLAVDDTLRRAGRDAAGGSSRAALANPLVRGTALLFLATLPPFVVWSTGGLATLPATLALFLAADALAGRERARPVLAALAGGAAILLRADAHVFLAAIGTLAALGAWRRGERARLAGVVRGALGWILCFAAVTVWRRATFGDWLPHTARVKVGLTAMTLERGFDYVAATLLTVPALLLVLVVGWLGPRDSRWRGLGAPLLLTACVYALLVGGDFMTMGRLLVPGLPFAAIGLAGAAAVLATRVRVAPVLVGLAAVALSVPAAFDVHAVPEAVRARFHFRWNSPDYASEFRQWELMVTRGERWTALGKALRDHTPPDASLVGDAIGCVGYFSERTVYDLFGLTDRAALQASGPPERRSPGHDRRVHRDFFLDRDPTYVEVDLVPEGGRWRDFPQYWSQDPAAMRRLRATWIPVGPEYGCPPGSLLRLVRPLRSP